jgi:hypothetical protein
MLILGGTFAGSAYAMSGGEKKKKEQGPPINASSKEEENFIQYVPSFVWRQSRMVRIEKGWELCLTEALKQDGH